MRQCDVLIIGGGAAGMSYALALAGEHRDLKVILAERDRALGGVLRQCIHHGFSENGATGPEYAEFLLRDLKKTSTEILLDTEVTKIQKDGDFVYGHGVNPEGGFLIRAGKVILASGCYERSLGNLGISGTRPRGIYTAGELQRMINLEGFSPRGEAVIIGSGDIGLIIARRLEICGCHVERLVELQDKCPALPRNIQGCLEEYRLPLKLHSRVTKICGDRDIGSVIIEDMVTGETEEVSCDFLVVAAGLIPDRSLLEDLPDRDNIILAGNCERIFPSVEGIVHSVFGKVQKKM